MPTAEEMFNAAMGNPTAEPVAVEPTPVEPAPEPIDPIEPANPIEPVALEPVEPTEPVEPIATEPTPEPTDPYLTDFGLSKDEVKAVLDQKKEIEALRQNFTDPFADPSIKSFNNFVKQTGIKSAALFDKLDSTDLATADPIEVLALKEALENPELAGKYDLLKKEAAKKYYTPDPVKPDKDDPDYFDLMTEYNEAVEAKELKDLSMQRAVSKARAEIGAVKEKLSQDTSFGGPTPEQVAQHKATWTPVVNDIVNKSSKISIPLDEGSFTFNVPQEKLKQYAAEAGNLALTMPTGKESVELVSNYIQARVLSDNYHESMKAALAHQASEFNRKQLEKHANPTPPIQVNPAAGKLNEKPASQRLFDSLVN